MVAPPASLAQTVPLSAKIAYGVGAIAYGIKDNGFSVFLLIFYNQVMGLPADRVGFAILIALVIDAFVDPLIGVLSDRTDTRWGRRHPWLYASALPIALSWLLLWNPPHGSQRFTLGWLVVTAVFARAAIALNEVPSLAIAPELTRDYEERTVVMRYRYVFGWAGGLAILMLAYGVLLAPPLGAQTGPLAVPGYRNYAIFGATVMALSVLISALGTHRMLAHRAPNAIARQSLSATVGSMRTTLANRPFLILMLAAFFAYANQGVSFAMSNYLLGYVWRFGTREFVFYVLTLLASVVVTFAFITPVGRAMGKQRAAALLSIVSSATAILPYVLLLLGLFPPVGSVTALTAYLLCIAAATATGIGVMILTASMMADVVEVSEERTGRREEGLFYAGALVMQKCTSGVGILLSGLILAFARFPANAVAGHVDAAVLDRMTLVFAIVTMAFATLSALVFLRFPFGRAEHDARLAKLAVAAR